jgi:hypothetical protein
MPTEREKLILEHGIFSQLTRSLSSVNHTDKLVDTPVLDRQDGRKSLLLSSLGHLVRTWCAKENPNKLGVTLTACHNIARTNLVEPIP